VTLSAEDLLRLADVASEAARSAGALISSSRPQAVETKPGALSAAAQVVTDVDRAAEARILDLLEPTVEKHDLALLTEERDDDGGRHRRPSFWCIDPLDGTLPYVEGEPGHAVSIALVARSGVPLIGVAYLPAEDVLFRAVRGQGAWRNDVGFRAHHGERASTLSVYADRSFAAQPRHDVIRAGLDELAASLSLDGVELHTGAGGVVNACRVLEDGPACYFKLPKQELGGGSVWDFAATACLAREAGAVATDVFGASLDLNRADSTFMSHRGVLYASNDRIAQALRERCADWR
jgi:fructose-1,6-bisphosphatase/inositol monophosphatase family enzyme